MSIDLIVKNGHLVFPHEGIRKGDIGINNGKIEMIGKNLDLVKAKEVLDVKQNFIFPGVIDPHVHFGQFTQLDEDFIKETRSAATGGVSTVLVFYRSLESYDKIFDEIKKCGEERSCIDFSIHLGISTEEQILSIPKYIKDFGVTSFKFLMSYKGDEARKQGVAEMTDGVLYDSLSILKQHKGALACVHCENIELIRPITAKLKATGRTDPAAWAESRPDFTESEYVRRVLFLAELTGAPVYIVHLSSKKALEEVQISRQRFSKVFVETCPAYLAFTKESMKDTLLKMAPPVRAQEDIEALWDGIKNGDIQTIGSDHIARKKLEKYIDNIWDAPLGISGTALILPFLLSEGYHKRGISLERIAEITSYNVSKIFNLYPLKGNLGIGADADLVVVDLEKEQIVTNNILNSSCDYSIFENWSMKGWPVLTMLRGEVVMRDGEIIGRQGVGRFIRRDSIT